MLVDCDWVDSTTVEIAADDRQPWQQQQFIYEIGELITELNTDQLGRRTTTTTVDDIERLSRFHLIPACDGRTGRQTDGRTDKIAILILILY